MSDQRIKPVRRRSVPGRPGIYESTTAAGKKRYEFTFRDSAGKQRWRTVNGGVTAAAAARDDVMARMRRGERVTPTRITLEPLCIEWLLQLVKPRRSTMAWYSGALRNHVIPSLGHRRVSDIDVDDLARLVADLHRKGLAGTTIVNVLVPLGRVFDYAVRRGITPANPVRGLDRTERPRRNQTEMRILQRDEISLLLENAPRQYRGFLAAAIFSGLRLGELLGLRWSDIDTTSGIIRVRQQADSDGSYQPLKTRNAHRDVILLPSLAKLLTEHRLESPKSGDDDPVFTRTGSAPPTPNPTTTSSPDPTAGPCTPTSSVSTGSTPPSSKPASTSPASPGSASTTSATPTQAC